MTAPDADLDIKDVYSPQQITRLAALQGVASFAKGMFGTASPGALIELAEYVIGDDEPFDPVAEAHKAMAAIRFERGEDYNGYDPVYVDGHDGCEYDEDGEWDADWANPGAHEDGPLADWERELLGVAIEEHVVGDITVSDLAGFLTLPKTAVLLDADGDTWHFRNGGWGYGGSYSQADPREIFEDFGSNEYDELDFIVTNPEVLS